MTYIVAPSGSRLSASTDLPCGCPTGSVLVTVLRQDRRSLVARVQLTTAPLVDTLRWFWCPADPGLPPLRWGQLLDSLVRGQLVCPV